MTLSAPSDAVRLTPNFVDDFHFSSLSLGEAYASSDILLFPSDVETFGNVTLEALSSGCPAIVEKKCGEHLVDHGVNGLTCACGDAEGFYQATRKLVVEAALRKSMGVAARESAWKFERNIILQQMAENYKVRCLSVFFSSFFYYSACVFPRLWYYELCLHGVVKVWS